MFSYGSSSIPKSENILERSSSICSEQISSARNGQFAGINRPQLTHIPRFNRITVLSSSSPSSSQMKLSTSPHIGQSNFQAGSKAFQNNSSVSFSLRSHEMFGQFVSSEFKT